MPGPDSLPQEPIVLPRPLPIPDRDAPPAARPQRRLLAIGLLALAAVAVVALLALRPWSAPAPVTPLRLSAGPVAGAGPEEVVGLGRLVPRSRIVAIAAPFGGGDARIAALPVAEGERVQAGALLAVVDNEPALAAAVAQAEAALAAREAGLAQTRIATLSARDEARASLARAEAAIEAGQRDLARAEALAARQAAAEQVVDQRRLTLRTAEQDAARARALLLRYDVADMEAQADVLVARRAVESARADLDRARADLERARVRAPFDGTVLTIQARLGERPGSDGLMTFGGLADMIAEVEVYETHLRRLSPGLPVTLRAAALPGPIEGRVERVGAEILRQSLTDASPAANTDARVARVVVALSPDASATAAGFAGLQVVARFGDADRGGAAP